MSIKKVRVCRDELCPFYVVTEAGNDYLRYVEYTPEKTDLTSIKTVNATVTCDFLQKIISNEGIPVPSIYCDDILKHHLEKLLRDSIFEIGVRVTLGEYIFSNRFPIDQNIPSYVPTNNLLVDPRDGHLFGFSGRSIEVDILDKDFNYKIISKSLIDWDKIEEIIEIGLIGGMK